MLTQHLKPRSITTEPSNNAAWNSAAFFQTLQSRPAFFIIANISDYRVYIPQDRNVLFPVGTATTRLKTKGVVDEQKINFQRELSKRIKILNFLRKESEVDEITFQTCLTFLEELPESYPLPTIGPADDGAVALVWNRDRGDVVFIIEKTSYHIIDNAGSKYSVITENIPFSAFSFTELHKFIL